MINAVSIVNTSAVSAGYELHPTLFDDFVSYIDRCEKTSQTYITNLRQFVAWKNYANITQVTRQDVINYREFLLHEHDAIQLDTDSPEGWSYRTDKAGNRYTITCKPTTVKGYLQSVKQFFAWYSIKTGQADITAGIHSPKVEQDIHRKDALNPDDVLTIERDIAENATKRTEDARSSEKDTAGRISRATEQGKRLFAMYLLAVNCGLRTIELHRANVRDLETRNGHAVLYVWGKGRTEPDRKMQLPTEVYQAIREYLDIRSDSVTGNSPLFVSTGNRSGGRRIATTTISTMLKQAMKHAGYDSERITPHTLRHSAGTAVQEITGDLYKTQRYMRHRNPKTTEIYIHTNTEKQEMGIAQQVYDHYHGKTAETSGDSKDSKIKLENLLGMMTQEQIEQLSMIATAMTK